MQLSSGALRLQSSGVVSVSMGGGSRDTTLAVLAVLKTLAMGVEMTPSASVPRETVRAVLESCLQVSVMGVKGLAQAPLAEFLGGNTAGLNFTVRATWDAAHERSALDTVLG